MANKFKFQATIVTQFQLTNTLNNLVKQGREIYSIHNMSNDDFTIVSTEPVKEFDKDDEGIKDWIIQVKLEKAKTSGQ
jgi:hypothetical protein